MQVIHPDQVGSLIPDGATIFLGGLAMMGFAEEVAKGIERSFLAGKLREHDWNVSETARALKLPRSNLYTKIERYGLSRENP